MGGPINLDRSGLIEHARRIEGLGYATLFVPEHVGNQLAPIPALMTAAEATTTLRVGSLVFNSDHHNPVVLAHQALTMDLLTGGRLELGLGAGWLQPDYEVLGVAFPTAAQRIERLGEFAAVVRRLLAGDRGPFAGRHIRAGTVAALPAAIQAPHPPVLIGGGGRHLLTVAARYADIVDIAPRRPWPGRLDPASVTAAAVRRKLTWLREAAPDRFAALELSVYPAMTPVRVVADPARELDRIAEAIRGRHPGPALSPAELAESPHVLVGTVDSLVDKLVRMRAEYGISYVRVDHAAVDDFAPVVTRLAGT